MSRRRAINPTKAISITLNQSVIESLDTLLSPAQSRSKFIQDCIIGKLTGSKFVYEAETRQLMSALSVRTDCDPFLKKMLMQILLA